MRLEQWVTKGDNTRIAVEILDKMKATGLWYALMESAPKGALPLGSPTEDVCRGFGEIAGYNQALLNIELACQNKPVQSEHIPEDFGG